MVSKFTYKWIEKTFEYNWARPESPKSNRQLVDRRVALEYQDAMTEGGRAANWISREIERYRFCLNLRLNVH